MKMITLIGPALLGLAIMGCAGLSTGPDRPRSEDEAKRLGQLLEFTEQAHRADGSNRVRLYRELANSLTDCQDPLPCLKLAVMLEGIEPQLTDLDRARQLLTDSLAGAPGPLLSAYTRARLAELDLREREHRQLALVRRTAVSQRRQKTDLQDTVQQLQARNRELESRIKALETKIDALTSIEQSLKEGGPVE